jgi:hypothetical protein
MDFQQQFDSIFAPARPAERQMVGQLYMISYITQRQAGMPADKAAALLGVDQEIAESLYQEFLK